MTQSVINWAAGVVEIGAQEWSLIQPKLSSTSVFSGATFDKLIGPPRWKITVDLTAAIPEDLPARTAAILQLRGGLNLLSLGDCRHGGALHAAAVGGNHWARQLIPWSALMRNWSHAGSVPAEVAQGVQAHASSSFVQLAEGVVHAGFEYVAAVRMESSNPDAMAALTLNGGSAAMMGCIIRPATGVVESRWGPCVVQRFVSGSGWIVCMRFTPDHDFTPYIQVHAMHTEGQTYPVNLESPVLAMASLGVPPVFHASQASAVYGPVQVQIQGAGQQGGILRTCGWVPSSRIRAGAWLNYGDGMHQILRAEVVGSDGCADLWIEPPIRKSPADGASVVVVDVKGLWKLLSTPVIRQEPGVAKGLTLEFEEWLA